MSMDEAYAEFHNTTPSTSVPADDLADDGPRPVLPDTGTLQVRNAVSGVVHAYVGGTQSVCRRYKCGVPGSPATAATFSETANQWSAADNWCTLFAVCYRAAGFAERVARAWPVTEHLSD